MIDLVNNHLLGEQFLTCKNTKNSSYRQKKWEQVLFPTPIINYPLSIINYRFTTFRMVTPCGTVMRSM